VIGIYNAPDLNMEFDSCTFASNTAGADVSSFRTAFVSTAHSLICVCWASSVAQGGAIMIRDAVRRVVVTNCSFERNRMVTEVRMRFVHEDAGRFSH
jgi:hypothetical protein